MTNHKPDKYKNGVGYPLDIDSYPHPTKPDTTLRNDLMEILTDLIVDTKGSLMNGRHRTKATQSILDLLAKRLPEPPKDAPSQRYINGFMRAIDEVRAIIEGRDE